MTPKALVTILQRGWADREIRSVLFGVLHSEQGLIGVLVVSLDAVAFSVVRYRCRTLWASILAHGFNNTIGLVGFFLVGPVHGLW